MKRITIFLVFFFSLLFLFKAITAAMLVDLSLEDLAKGADSIVIGTVERITCDRDENGKISTYVAFNVEKDLKSNLSQQKIIIHYPGGHIEGEVGSRIVDDVPELAQDEKALVFVKEFPRINVLGWKQGKFTIQGDDVMDVGQKFGKEDRIKLQDAILRIEGYLK